MIIDNENQKLKVHEWITKYNEEGIIGYEFIKSKGVIKRADYEEHFEFEKKKAERHLNKMVEANLIERKGAGRSTYYVIIAT